jgi:hypothetical protein
MSQKETDQLNRMMLGAALSRAICTVADLADSNEPSWSSGLCSSRQALT